MDRYETAIHQAIAAYQRVHAAEHEWTPVIRAAKLAAFEWVLDRYGYQVTTEPDPAE